MPSRIEVSPEILEWAITRSQKPRESVIAKTKYLSKWLAGESQPTFSQLKSFASKMNIALPLLLRSEPFNEPLAIKDFRRVVGTPEVPSPELLDTIRICRARQDWYRNFLISENVTPPRYVGSIRPNSDVVTAAKKIREAINFDLAARIQIKDWNAALSSMIDGVEDSGCLVMINGIVGNNTHRPLSTQEFRGFSLADSIAPIIFINGTDSLAARLFTIGHELAHIWLGEDGVSNADPLSNDLSAHEKWCNAVSAEILVPKEDLIEQYQREVGFMPQMVRLRNRYKVSSQVLLISLKEMGLITQSEFDQNFTTPLKKKKKSSGGDFYLSQRYRLSREFVSAVAYGTQSGVLSYTYAYRLLEVQKSATFDKILSKLAVKP